MLYFAATTAGAASSAKTRQRHDLVAGDLLLQFGQDAFGLGGDRHRLGDGQMLERIAIAGAVLGQRMMHPARRSG